MNGTVSSDGSLRTAARRIFARSLLEGQEEMMFPHPKALHAKPVLGETFRKPLN
jgi:hypothetical protein